MPNPLVDGLFLLAFWAPPLAVVAGALLLLVPRTAQRSVVAPRHAAAVTH